MFLLQTMEMLSKFKKKLLSAKDGVEEGEGGKEEEEEEEEGEIKW